MSSSLFINDYKVKFASMTTLFFSTIIIIITIRPSLAAIGADRFSWKVGGIE